MVGGTVSGALRRQALSTDHASPEPTAFLYEADDARAFLKDRPRAGKIITLTPNARAVLLAAGIEAIPSSRVFTDRHHRQITARIRRADRQLCAMFDRADIKLGEAAKETLRHDMCLVAMTALRLWMTFGRVGPYLVFGPQGWYKTESRLEVFKAFRSHLVSDQFEHRDMIKPPRFSRLTKCINRGAARLMRGSAPIIVTAYQYGLKPLSRRFDDNGMPTLQLSGSRHTKGDYLHSVRSIWRWMTGRDERTLIAVVEAAPQAQSLAQVALNGVTDPIIRLWLDVVGSRLTVEAGYTETAVLEFKELIRRLQPKMLVGHTFRWSDEAALAEAAGAKGVKRVLISHGSHALQESAVAFEATCKHARGMLYSSLADTVVAQSPHAERLINVQSVQPDTVRAKPVMWGYKPLPATTSKNRPRRILHAGTYKTLFGFWPMMFETSDEFIDGLIPLIGAVDGMPDTELVIRVRPAPECDISTLHALLPVADNCTIKSDGAFLDDLAEADLLVSYSSTTIEEAIHADRPALLWGGASHYRHLPAECTLPDKNHRNAVYSVDSVANLKPMIEAILDSHAKIPLTDLERKNYCWGDNTASGEAILERVQATVGRVI